jgi:2-polyprenyl-3-methyl-5-hydroxy-6-metoxy-1,4-benzoquinol methylase
MRLRALLAAKGIHYLATRFGSQKLRSMAFDEKYRRGDWRFHDDGPGELAEVIQRNLRNGDLLLMGCGGASVLAGIESDNLSSVLGIDLSEEALRLANQYSSAKASFLVAEMETFVCPRNYDVILFSESLNYIPAGRQLPLLKRLGGSLKENGVFIVTFSQARRYMDIIYRIRGNYFMIEDRSFVDSERHLLVFRPRLQSE